MTSHSDSPRAAGLADAANDAERVFWISSAVALLAVCAVLTLCSLVFVHGEGHQGRPLLEMILLLLLGGVIWIAASLRALRRPPPLRFVLVVALLARALLVLGEPIQEDDIYRYLWDGRVVVEGISPYRFSPDDIEGFALDPTVYPREDHSTLAELADLSVSTDGMAASFARINNREFATIYPPVAQAVFGVFGLVVPAEWSAGAQVRAMKLLLSSFDVGVLLAVALLCRRLGKPPGLALLYGWCPLVLKEISNSGHMDAIPAFFLLVSMVALLDRRALAAGVLLGGAIGAKVYAVLLVPLFARWLGLRGSVVLVVSVAAVVLGLQGTVGEGVDRYHETLARFALRWEKNAAVFSWVESGVRMLPGAGGSVQIEWPPGRGEEPVVLEVRVARIATLGLAAAALGALVLAAVRRRRRGPLTEADIPRLAFVLLAGLFLLGPLGFPWYFVWCLPLLPFTHLRSWLLLPVLLSLYYTFFWVVYQHPERCLGFEPGEQLFHVVIVSVEFGVFFVCAGAEILWRRRRSARLTRRVGEDAAGGSRPG